MEKELEAQGVLKESFIYVWDEMSNSQFPAVKKWGENWKKNSRIPQLVVTYTWTALKGLDGTVDIWCGISTTKEETQRRRALGEEFWTCNSAYLFAREKPLQEGRFESWNAFLQGQTGCLLYGTADWSTDPWFTPFRHGSNMCGQLFYPVKQGIAASPRFKNFAESVEDYEYLQILKTEADAARKEGRADCAVKRADELFKELEAMSKNPEQRTGAKLLAFRRACAETIELLLKAK